MKLAIVGSLVAAVLALTGCSGSREALCQSDEYPVWSTSAPGDGRACVVNGQEPPVGYARYPKGHAPHWLDEDYNPVASASPTIK